MTPASDVVCFGFVVEGQGEVEAFPLLIRRISNDLCGVFNIRTTRPVRITKTKLVRPGELERAIRLAQYAAGSMSAIIVLIDADDDCPAILGPQLAERARPLGGAPVVVIIPHRELENWFLAAAGSLSGKRGLPEGLVAPDRPEEIRGAKEWLSNRKITAGRYSPTVDQAPLVAIMDLQAARACRSFDRLVRKVQGVVNPNEAL
jgi:hypothetical protein